MKNYKELIKEYNEIFSTLDPRNEYEKAKQYRDEFLKIQDLPNFNELNAKLDNKLIQEETEQNNKLDYLKVLKNNILYSINAEMLPQAIAVINGYQGKKLGEKTKEKINNDLKAINKDFNIFIGNKDIYIYYNDNPTFSIEASFTTDKNNNYNYFSFTDNENKVNNLALNMFYCYGIKDYIDDMPQFIKDQEQEINKIALAYKALQNEISEYNAKFSGTSLYKNLCVRNDNIPYIR